MTDQEIKLESAVERLPACLEGVLQIANGEKEALGFIPNSAYSDAARQRRLLVAVRDSNVIGFVLFGGVFPHARIQQIGVRPANRRAGVASVLMSALLARLERDGFLTVKAKVALDLPAAQAFYAKHGFESAHTIDGGEARQRKIVVRLRHLEAPSLLDAGGNAIDWSKHSIPLALRRSPAGEVPLYVIDLNVLFDLVRDRNRSDDARHLFSAALSHRLRIAVAGEFIQELRRTSTDASSDPLLKLALQLPRVPKVDEAELKEQASNVHALVFGQPGTKGAATPQAQSDARHVAHASLVGAAGFITSDQTILDARDALLEKLGVDVAGLDELVSLLPTEATSPSDSFSGAGFVCRQLSCSEAGASLRALGAGISLLDEFCREDGLNRRTERFGILEDDHVIAVGAVAHPKAIDGPTRILVQVPQNHSAADLFAEHLIELGLKHASRDRPASIELCRLPGQTVVSRVAKAKGFAQSHDLLSKVALGRPLTRSNWNQLRAQIRRRSGIELPMPDGCSDSITIRDALGQAHKMLIEQLEDLLSPTIVAWPERDAVVVSIQKKYADELLGTSDQGSFAFVESRPASFLSRRAYVSSPRNASAMRGGKPILFYESERSGGRGAIVAAGRIVDTLLQPKSAVSGDNLRRLVVDDVDDFSASSDVIVTTFDNILTFPRAYLRRELVGINAIGSSNLQAATPMTSDNLNRVLDAAWS